MLNIVPSNQFRKDLKLAKKRGLNLDLLRDVVNTLAMQQPLDPKYRDHTLSGNYRGFRECHVQPDWLLVDKADKRSSKCRHLSEEPQRFASSPMA